MQTFLPYPDFKECARVLDNVRHNKQIVECQQILDCLLDPTKKGWQNHPAVKMWRGHETALCTYMALAVAEWQRRKYAAGTYKKQHGSWIAVIDKWHKGTRTHLFDLTVLNVPWLGREDIHSSHRANLIRKDPTFYGQYGWTEEPAEGYVWPV
jgi:hypothetical protein